MYTASIVAGTVVCGCLNSLLTKYQDNQCVAHCSDPARRRNYEQPGIQTLQMFIGELALFVVYWLLNRRRWEYELLEKRTWAQTALLSVPSVCDLLATTFMNVGLVYTPVLVYQMTRGAVVLFVALLSVVFLQRRITALEWILLVVVTAGIAIVGVSGQGSASPHEDPAQIVFGILLIVLAVALQAVQFVVEEKILSRFLFTPMRLVYTEGFFGAGILVVALVVLNYVFGALQPPARFEQSPFNLHESLRQTVSHGAVLALLVMIMVCIAAFNFCGLLLTHQLSATARSTIDSCRTLLVWLFAMALGWESFHLLQMFGFATLVFGTLCFNGVLRPEEWRWVPRRLRLAAVAAN